MRYYAWGIAQRHRVPFPAVEGQHLSRGEGAEVTGGDLNLRAGQNWPISVETAWRLAKSPPQSYFFDIARAMANIAPSWPTSPTIESQTR